MALFIPSLISRVCAYCLSIKFLKVVYPRKIDFLSCDKASTFGVFLVLLLLTLGVDCAGIVGKFNAESVLTIRGFSFITGIGRLGPVEVLTSGSTAVRGSLLLLG